jgi:hypothetical protein
MTKSIPLGILVMTTILTHTWAQDRPFLEGALPYRPSRLEWLAVNLSAELRVPLSVDNGFSMNFVPMVNENTILIYVRYIPSVVNREVMNLAIDGARKVISMISKSHDWDSWLIVKEDVQAFQMAK